MGTEVFHRTNDNDKRAADLVVHIARVRDGLIDADILVDDRRRDVDASVDALRVAVRERDRAAAYLAYLIELHNEIADVAATFGGEIAGQYAAVVCG
jgi:hypothetical protein